MKIQVSRIDANGFYVEPVIVNSNDKLNADLIVEPVPPGFFSPKWDGTAWVEGLTPAELQRRIDEALAQAGDDLSLPEKVYELDQKLKQTQQALNAMMFG